MKSDIRIINLYHYGKKLSTKVQCSYAVYISFGPIDSTHYQGYLVPFPIPSTMRFFHRFVTQSDCFVTLYTLS